MKSFEVLGVQTARRALDQVRADIEDPLARDRLDRIETVLARVAANLGARAAFDAALPSRPAAIEAGIGWDHATAQGWEAAVAGFDPRQRAAEAASDDLTGRLQDYLAKRHGAGAPRVTSARRLPGGRSKHTLIVDLEDAGALPARIVLRTDSSRTTDHDSVAREFPLVRAVHAAGCPVPEPLWFEADDSVVGAPFIAFAHVAGAPAGNLWGAFDGGSDAARELARALAGVHAVPVTAVPGGRVQPARAAVADLLTSYEARWKAALPRPSTIIGNAFAWLRERLDRVEGDAVIVHGDAHFSNMLMQDGRLSCLLDWEFWHFGHPAEDVAYARPYVEQTLDWGEFLDIYLAAGGRPVTTAQLDLFAIWRPLRNAVLASTIAHDFRAHEDLDLETAAIALSTFPRMEGQVAAALAKV